MPAIRTMPSESVCVDERYSTTRLLFRDCVNTGTESNTESVKHVTVSEGLLEGGLRTKGLSKREVLNKPLVTVITVVFNGAQGLEDTIRSVVHQSYDNVEYIVIDGGSTDGSLETLRRFDEVIDYWVSAPDRGIYDAMNKGLQAARGEWVNFMNAGDAFCSKESIASTVKEFSQAMVYYSDAIFFFERGESCYYREVKCDARRHQFIHQSCIYRKQLHSIYGQYLVAKGVTASDYLFFKGVPCESWQKTKTIICKYHVGDNVSSGTRHAAQVYGADLFFGNRSIRKTFAVYCLETIKSFIRRIQKSVLTPDRYVTRVEKFSRVRREVFWRDYGDY